MTSRPSPSCLLVLLLTAACAGGPGAPKKTTSAPAQPVIAPPGGGTASLTEASRPRANPPAVLQGQAVPLTTMDGRRGALLDYAGPITVLAFWSTYCKPCIRELPYLDALHRQHQQDGDVAVLAINTDEAAELDKAREVIAPLHLSLPVLVDGQGAVRRRVNQILGKEDSGGEFALPLVIMLDPASHVFGEVGFKTGTSREAYLAEKDQLIVQARSGSLPHHPPERVAVPPGAMVGLSFKKLSDAEIARDLPVVRQQLQGMSAKLTDKDLDRMLAQVKAAMHKGGSVRLQMPR